MRATIIVLDSLGVGELPDAEKYGDRGADTLGHILDNYPLDIPHLRSLGLGNIERPEDPSGKVAGGRLAVSAPEGVYIVEVTKGSAADKAGLQSGDVITAIGSVPVKSMAEVQAKVASYRPGDKAKVTVIRDGETLNYEVTFLSSEDANAQVGADGSVSFYGSTLRKADEKVLKRLGLKGGVLIEEAGTGKMRQSGAADGFIILYVNDQPVSTPQDVVNIAKKAKKSVFFQGVTSTGREAYFGFGKE